MAAQAIRLDVRGFPDEYKRKLPGRLSEHNDSDDPETFCTDFKSKFLKMSVGCLRGTPGTFKSFLTKATLNIIEELRRARHEGKGGQYRELKRKALRAVTRDKEAQGCGFCETLDMYSTCGQVTLVLLQRNSDVAFL